MSLINIGILRWNCKKKEHRKFGIGKQLMEDAIKIQKLLVGVGNESVIDYYKQFDFLPLHIVLQRKEQK